MAFENKPLYRYVQLDRCFRSKIKSYWSTSDLLKKLRDHDLPVSRRTLFRDISDMINCERLNYRAPISYSSRHGGFYYTDPDYRIDLRIKHNQVKQLREFARASEEMTEFLKELLNVADE